MAQIIFTILITSLIYGPLDFLEFNISSSGSVAKAYPQPEIGRVLGIRDDRINDVMADKASRTDVIAGSKKRIDKKPVDKLGLFTVERIIDGDTIDVSADQGYLRLRLIGINTPEVIDPRRPVQCFGREASSKAKEWLAGKRIRFEYDKTQDKLDKYGRHLAYVYREDGFFYNLEIIKAGYAYEYTYIVPYKFQKEFRAAQSEARLKKRGLWSDSSCQKTNKDSNCFIKGNINNKQERIYHLPNCPYYNKTIIDETRGEKWFCSEEEATRAGWKKAGGC